MLSRLAGGKVGYRVRRVSRRLARVSGGRAGAGVGPVARAARHDLAEQYFRLADELRLHVGKDAVEIERDPKRHAY
jgi:hypothetical protein